MQAIGVSSTPSSPSASGTSDSKSIIIIAASGAAIVVAVALLVVRFRAGKKRGSNGVGGVGRKSSAAIAPTKAPTSLPSRRLGPDSGNHTLRVAPTSESAHPTLDTRVVPLQGSALDSPVQALFQHMAVPQDGNTPTGGASGAHGKDDGLRDASGTRPQLTTSVSKRMTVEDYRSPRAGGAVTTTTGADGDVVTRSPLMSAASPRAVPSQPPTLPHTKSMRAQRVADIANSPTSFRGKLPTEQ